MNKGGKTLTIFVVVIIVLLISISSIALFFFQLEIERREVAEGNLAQVKMIEMKLRGDVKEAKKKIFLLEEKNKESDERINSLLDDLELEQGLREEMKNEQDVLKEALESQTQSKDETRVKLSKEVESIRGDLSAATKELGQKAATLVKSEKRVHELENLAKNLEVQKEDLIKEKIELEGRIKGMSPDAEGQKEAKDVKEVNVTLEQANIEEVTKVEEPKVPEVTGSLEGRVISVDKKASFLICSLGEKDGIKQNDVMAVFRGDDYLGDVRISRVQTDMSAADFIPPLTSRKVQKNDRVRSID